MSAGFTVWVSFDFQRSNETNAVYEKTIQCCTDVAAFGVAAGCALKRMMLEEHNDFLELAELRRFLDAVRDGNDLAAV